MKDIILLDTKMLMDAYIRQVDKDNTLLSCKNLILFSYEKKLLLKYPFDERGNLNIDTVIKESDLTDLGKQLFDDLADQWFAYTDRTQKYDNVAMLEKYFSKLFKMKQEESQK